MTAVDRQVLHEEEITKRRLRGQEAGFTIENLGDDHPFFSFFRVKGASHLSYEVEIHSLRDDGKNCCTCPDYRYNGLGTCKHIEAVLQNLRDSSAQAYTWTSQKQPEVENAIYTRWIDGRERLCYGCVEKYGDDEAKSLFPGGVLTEGLEPDAPELLEYFERAKAQKVQFMRSALNTLDRLNSTQDLFRKVLIREREGLNATVLRKPLKEHQVKTVRFLLENRQCVVSEPFGTGKRIASLGAVAMVKKVKGNAKLVIVTDANYFSHWKRLIKIFYPQGVHVLGESLQRGGPDPFAVKPIFLCSYATLLRDAQQIESLGPTVLIFDEIQQVRKWTGQTGQLVKSLKAPYTFFLSSTPVMASDVMVLNLTQYLFPTEFGPLWLYLATSVERNHWGKVYGYHGMERFRELLKRVVLSRPTEELDATLPKRSKIRVILSLNSKQKRIMAEQLTKLSALAGTRFEWSKKDMVAIIETIRNLRLGLGEISHLFEGSSSTPKQEYLALLLTDLMRYQPKIILNTHWGQFLEPLQAIVEQAGYVFLHIESALQAQKFATFQGPIVGLVLDRDLNTPIDDIDFVINYDLPWSKELLKKRRLSTTNTRTGRLVEFNLVVASSVEERGMVVVETLPKLIGEWFDSDLPEKLPDPQTIRNLIRKLAGRREERVTSSSLRRTEKSSRERKISLKGMRELGRPGSRAKERILGIGSAPKSYKKSIIWNGTSPLPSFDGITVLLDFQIVPSPEGPQLALATLVNPANSLFMAFTPEHIHVLSSKLSACAYFVGSGTKSSSLEELYNRFFPEVETAGKVVDFSRILSEKAAEPLLLRDISEATLGKRMVWDENELRRLSSGKRFGDLAEVAQSDLKISWTLMAYIAREQRFFAMGKVGREEHQLPLEGILPEEVLELLLSRHNI